ncbi:MAG: hypothetical protein BWY31_01554 [Lentisphaerae bacterium ADurb.Bin242]|nr:MAG: hypothetical protein BWY31_01554 [Lentisphaerae bacterium ADurb.Bin242]
MKLCFTALLFAMAVFQIIADDSAFHYFFDKDNVPETRLKEGAVVSDGLLKLDAPGARLEVPESGKFNFSETGGTLMMVCRFRNKEQDPKRFQFLANKGGSFLFGITGGRYNFSLCQDKRWQIALMGGEPPPDGQWVHLAAVARRIENKEQGAVGFQLEIYVNGERILGKFFQCVQPNPDETSLLTLGNTSHRYHFQGDIAEASFHRRALLPAEIEQAARSDKRIKMLSPGFAEVSAELAVRLETLKKDAITPLALFSVSGIADAAATGADPEEISILLPKMAVLLKKQGVSEKEFIGEWNRTQKRFRLIPSGDTVLLLVVGKGKGCFPILGWFDRRSSHSVFGPRAATWKIDWILNGNPSRLEDFSEPVTYTVSEPRKQGNAVQFTLRWEAPALAVNVPVIFSGNRLECGFEVLNSDPERLLKTVVFPDWRLARLPGKDTLLYPTMSGQLSENPTETFSYERDFPTAENSMQLRAYYNEAGTGIYAAMEDPKAWARQTSVSGRRNQLFMSWQTAVPFPCGATGGNHYRQSGNAVLELFRGNWYDAGQIYKRFLAEKAEWWIPERPRKSTPPWMRDNAIWILAGVYPRQNEQTLLYLRDYFEMPFGVHLVRWTPNRNWPHFNKITPRAAELLRSLRKAGLRVHPYTDPRLWAVTDSEDLKQDWKYSSEGKAYAVKNEKGQPVTENYGVDCATMCPGARGWQKFCYDVVKSVAGFGFDGVYHDQLPCGRPELCFDPAHGHLANDPSVWLSGGYWPMYEKIHSDLKKQYPELAHTGEDASDPYLKTVDGYTCWRWIEPGHVPLFQSVYAGRVQFTGRLFNHQYPGDWNSSFAKVAEQLVFGEQLGWITLEDLEAATHLRLYFKKLAFLRKALLEYFNTGDMRAPLSFRKPVPELASFWGNTKTPQLLVKTPAVLSSSWRLSDGKTMTLFVNTLPTAIEVEPVLEKKTTLRICREGNSSPETVGPDKPIPLVKLAPYASEIWLTGAASAEAERIAEALKKIASFDMGKTLFIQSEKRKNPLPVELVSGKWQTVARISEYFRCYFKSPKSGGGIPEGILLLGPGSRIDYHSVDCGPGIRALELEIAADRPGCEVEIFLRNSAAGSMHSTGRTSLGAAGTWFDFRTVRVPLEKELSGKQELVFQFYGGECRYKGFRAAKQQ